MSGGGESTETDTKSDGGADVDAELDLDPAAMEARRRQIFQELEEMEGVALVQLVEVHNTLDRIRALKRRVGCEDVPLPTYH